ncbi:unnamed protein product [Closterium sp. NIES-53]
MSLTVSPSRRSRFPCSSFAFPLLVVRASLLVAPGSHPLIAIPFAALTFVARCSHLPSHLPPRCPPISLHIASCQHLAPHLPVIGSHPAHTRPMYHPPSRQRLTSLGTLHVPTLPVPPLPVPPLCPLSPCPPSPCLSPLSVPSLLVPLSLSPLSLFPLSLSPSPCPPLLIPVGWRIRWL